MVSFKNIIHRLKTPFMVLLPGITIFLVQYVWKTAYLREGVPGLYWLFVLLDRLYLPLIAVFSIAGIVFLVVRRFSKPPENKHLFLLVSLSLFILSASVTSTLPVVLANNTFHMQSVRAEGRIYYMGAYPLFDINFYVAECDPLGILCRKIYRSGDIMDTSWDRSRLYYDETKKVLELHEPEKGIIFSHQVPKQ